MTPVWIFPAYPLLIIGPIAGVVPTNLASSQNLKVIVGGFTFQGIGFMVSLLIYSAFIYRLMTQKLPQESLRPGMFVSVGPAGFTVASIISMSEKLETVVPADFMGDGKMMAFVLSVVANWLCLWLWGLVIPYISGIRLHLTTNWSSLAWRCGSSSSQFLRTAPARVTAVFVST